MKRILILIIGLIGIAYGQSSPTSAKTRFVNGIYLGTKLDSYFAAADSNAIYWRADSALMAKYKGTARRVVFSGELGSYIPYSDTTSLLSQVVRTFGTQTIGGNKTFTNDIFASTARIGIGAGGNTSNSVLGYNVFTANTTGTKNTAMGENSLSSNVSATDNTAFGWYSLDAATGSGNTGIGSGALGTNTSGSNNTALGFGAGEYITGTNPNTTGTNSIYIGFNTKAAANGETNQTVIGHNLTGNGSNTVTIGNSSVTDNYFSGNIRGGAFIKSGGTSSQFLKADGSVDGTAYGTGSVSSVSAGIGMSFTTITGTGAVNADTTTLATRAYASGLDVAKANTSLNNVNGVLSSTYGGAGSVSGILKANGSGVVSAATAADIPSLSSYYLPLSGGTLTLTSTSTPILRFDYNGSSNYAQHLMDNNGDYTVNIPSANGVTSGFYNIKMGGSSAFRIFQDRTITLTNTLNGTSLSMSGIGLFNGAVDDGTNKLIVNGGVKATSLDVTSTVARFNSGGNWMEFNTNVLTSNDNTGAHIRSIIADATAPTYSWKGDQNTGMWNPAADELGFVTGGVNRLTISSTGAATFISSVYAQGYRFAYASKSSNYTLTDTDDYINVTASCTITLPTAVGRAGKRYVIKCIGSVTATIASTSSETIDGNSAGTYTFGGPNFNIMIVYSNGTNWNLEAWQTGI